VKRRETRKKERKKERKRKSERANKTQMHGKLRRENK